MVGLLGIMLFPDWIAPTVRTPITWSSWTARETVYCLVVKNTFPLDGIVKAAGVALRYMSSLDPNLLAAARKAFPEADSVADWARVLLSRRGSRSIWC